MAFVSASPLTAVRAPTLHRRRACGTRPQRAPACRNAVMASIVREVSDKELEVALRDNERPILLDAFARWCGPCQFLMPQLDIVADKFGDRLDVFKLDTEKYPEISTQLAVKGLPTLFFVKDGKLRYRMEGALVAEQLEEAIEFVLFDGPAPSFAKQAGPEQ